MKKEEKESPVLQQFAMIWNYNAHVEHQHNNYYACRQDIREEKPQEPFVPCELRFFDPAEFGTEERLPRLRETLDELATQIDVSSGRAWFGIYAGYRYYKRQLAVTGGYADFFADIEALLPGRLQRIDASKEGDARYRAYTTLLGREAQQWYMDKGKLPPLNEITTWEHRFGGDRNRFLASAKVIIDVYKRLKAL